MYVSVSKLTQHLFEIMLLSCTCEFLTLNNVAVIIIIIIIMVITMRRVSTNIKQTFSFHRKVKLKLECGSFNRTLQNEKSTYIAHYLIYLIFLVVMAMVAAFEKQ
uniref:Uncharacterized protein n=1 Tax=Glossina pallidipes TaxID=7398 RepID=A0A1A9ZIJ8_GLOPL